LLEGCAEGAADKFVERLLAHSAFARGGEHRVERGWAEADAKAAVDFAASAIREAEYAVLDAHLARMNADAMAAKA
jgi:hypothetical protein